MERKHNRESVALLTINHTFKTRGGHKGSTCTTIFMKCGVRLDQVRRNATSGTLLHPSRFIACNKDKYRGDDEEYTISPGDN